jgi:hypothetical protein
MLVDISGKYHKAIPRCDLSDDIPALANVAIGKINQTNPGVVRGIDSVPGTNLEMGLVELRIRKRKMKF